MNQYMQGHGTRGWGVVWGGWTPLELGFYRVKITFFKISYLFGPPLEKIRSLAPVYI